jgi:tetratricopeptide (TPR) repeat protein
MWSRIKSAFLSGGASQVSAKYLDRVFNEAVGHLQNGDGIRAEESVHAAATLAAEQAGTDSSLYVQALFNEATILCGVGDLARAAAACRAAAAVPAKTRDMQKERLTCLMNLGEILTRMDQLQDAEQVLREGLAERESFYGVKHSGYAFGLTPLAENLLAQGRPDEALPAVNQAIEINWANGNPQVAGDLALRLFVMKAWGGPDAEAIPLWTEVPPDIQQEIVNQCLERADRSDPQTAQAALVELRRRLQDTPDRDVAPLLNVNIALANVARLTGDHDVRIEAGTKVVKLCGGLDDPHHLVEAYQGLACALSDAGREDDAERAYYEAIQICQKIGDRRELANVLRNYAIWADDRQRTELAESLHRQALEHATASKDALMKGRSLAALGIFLQHHDRGSEAAPLLAEAQRLLPASHPDAFCVQTHWEALQRGEPCSCGAGDDWEAISTLVVRQVKEHVAGDLLKSIRIGPNEEGSPDIHVELAREPTPNELEHLNRVINQTMAQMRQRYRSAGYHED